MFLKAATVILMAVTFSACTPKQDVPNDPKQVLKAYISKSFSVKSSSEKVELVGYLARDAKARLAAWSDDQFRDAFIENKREFVKLVFTEAKSVSPQQTDITYELTYIDQAKGREAKVTQKKLAQLIQDHGKWFISNVQNIKELVEYRHEMSLP